MEKKNNHSEKSEEKEPIITDVNTVVSSTECTGLTPNRVLSQAEAESYEDIYPIPLTEKEKAEYTKDI